MGARDDALAARAELIAQLEAAVPQALRERPQWLMWKLIRKPNAAPGAKPLKVPFYVSGQLRGWPNGKPKDGKPTEAQPQVEQGHDLDRASLVGFDVALRALAANQTWTGVGFAFLPGDGLIGVDIDGAIDLESGEISRRCQLVMQMCPSYTEVSVSGTGVHIILTGDVDNFKADSIGLEVYCKSQYFTVSGRHWLGSPAEVLPVDPESLYIMRGMVEQARAKDKAERDLAAALKHAAADGQAAPARPRPAASGSSGRSTGNDFKRVNADALVNLGAWVPLLLPAATRWRNGYRVKSKDMGRDLQEDLQIVPEGIMDFGEEAGKSPIDLVMQFGGKSLQEALQWLASALGITLTKLPPTGSAGRRPQPEEDGPAVEDERPEPPPPAPTSEKRPTAPRGGRGAEGKGGPAGGGSDGQPPKDIDWEKFERLRCNFALIYGTDTVWDGEQRMIMKIANMGHAHGSDAVRLWKGGKSSPKRGDTPGARWTVMPARVVFDPTESCDADTHVNLYGGFPTVPVEGNVAPMLELIKFLCSRAAECEVECEGIYHWFMCWWAYPLQNKGAKLRTSVVMHGDEGAGKNFLTDTMVMMYGEYGITVGQDELEDKFNDWRSGKTLVIGDEVSSRAELVHNKNRLKALITSTEVQINPKNMPRRTEKNHINVVFNSNELQPLALDNSDRRYLVLYTPKAREFLFYRKLGEWRDKGGVAAFYHYLLHYNLEGFDPFAPAPVTRAKADLIDMNRKSPERFWLEWSSGELGLPYRSCAGPQAYAAYVKYAHRTGDRFPVQRALFTRMVLRVSDTMGKPLIDKNMNVDYAAMGKGSVKRTEVRTTRMLLVMPPPEDVGQGEWATDCYHQFEIELKRYLGRYGDDSDGGEGGAPA
jgi:putative DNA primase/helicase